MRRSDRVEEDSSLRHNAACSVIEKERGRPVIGYVSQTVERSSKSTLPIAEISTRCDSPLTFTVVPDTSSRRRRRPETPRGILARRRRRDREGVEGGEDHSDSRRPRVKVSRWALRKPEPEIPKVRRPTAMTLIRAEATVRRCARKSLGSRAVDSPSHF